MAVEAQAVATERAPGGAMTAAVAARVAATGRGARAAAAAPGMVLAGPGARGARVRIVPATAGPPDGGPTHQETAARAARVPVIVAVPAGSLGSAAADIAAEMVARSAVPLVVPSRRKGGRPPGAARPRAGTAAGASRSTDVKPAVGLDGVVRATVRRVLPEATRVDAERVAAEGPQGAPPTRMTAEQTVTGKGSTARVVTGAVAAAAPEAVENAIEVRPIGRDSAHALTAVTVARDPAATDPVNAGRIGTDGPAPEGHGARATIAMVRPAGPVGVSKGAIRGAPGRGRATRATRAAGRGGILTGR